MAICFIVLLAGGLLTLIRPMQQPVTMPVNDAISLESLQREVRWHARDRCYIGALCLVLVSYSFTSAALAFRHCVGD